MSGTKMRQAAVANDYAKFKEGVLFGNMTDEDVRELMKSIRTGLGIMSGGSRRKTRRIRIKKRRRGTYRLRLEERT